MYCKIREYYNIINDETTTFLIPDSEVEFFDKFLESIYRKEEAYSNTGSIMEVEELEDELNSLSACLLFDYSKYIVKDELYDLNVVMPDDNFEECGFGV